MAKLRTKQDRIALRLLAAGDKLGLSLPRGADYLALAAEVMNELDLTEDEKAAPTKADVALEAAAVEAVSVEVAPGA